MTMTTLNIAAVSDLYSKLSESLKISEEDELAWNQACDVFLLNATTTDELEKLLRLSRVFRGIAAGTIHAKCFKECQERLMTFYAEKIPGCTTIDEIRGVVEKLRKIREAEIHLTIGGAVNNAIQRACQKWYELCVTKEEMVRMIRQTRNVTDVYDFI